jgi:hypothetical protein
MPWLLAAVALAVVALAAFLFVGEEPREAEAIAANPTPEKAERRTDEPKETDRRKAEPKEVETEAGRSAENGDQTTKVLRTDPVVLSSPKPKPRKVERQRPKRHRRRRAPSRRATRPKPKKLAPAKPKKTVPKDGIITEW